MNGRAQKKATLALSCALVVLATGCHTVKLTEPPRSAVEQLLLSTAADRAVEGTDLSWLEGKRVFVEDKYFESYDRGYAISSIRQHISESGGRLVALDTNTDFIVEIRSGGLGELTSETLVGIPSMGLPVPLAGPLQTPELAFYKSQKSEAYSKFALFAYESDSRQYVRSTGFMDGRAHYRLYKIMFISWKRTDIPEINSKKAPRKEK